jgi:sulfite reductase (NADPH) flavoprotein alpha-component
MNQITPPPRMDIIPANAPFSDQQRQWLNGFLVGMLGLDGTTPLSPEQTSAMLGPTGDGDDGTTRPCRSPTG